MTLTAVPDPGSAFDGWSGACTGTGTCQVTMANARYITAGFAKLPDTIATRYYHTDMLGSVRAITDETGAVVIRHDYRPFGEDTQPLTGDPVRFAGKQLDAETGQQYFDARYYRQTWGRFTTVDPLHVGAAMTEPQRWNRYAYVRGNPLKFVDPTGLFDGPVFQQEIHVFTFQETSTCQHGGVYPFCNSIVTGKFLGDGPTNCITPGCEWEVENMPGAGAITAAIAARIAGRQQQKPTPTPTPVPPPTSCTEDCEPGPGPTPGPNAPTGHPMCQGSFGERWLDSFMLTNRSVPMGTRSVVSFATGVGAKLRTALDVPGPRDVFRPSWTNAQGVQLRLPERLVLASAGAVYTGVVTFGVVEAGFLVGAAIDAAFFCRPD